MSSTDYELEHEHNLGPNSVASRRESREDTGSKEQLPEWPPLDVRLDRNLTQASDEELLAEVARRFRVPKPAPPDRT